MNEDTLVKLEFEQIRTMLGGFCATALGKSLAKTMSPATKSRLVRDWLGQVSEMLAIVDDAFYPPMGGVHDIRAEVRASAFPMPLEADSLAQVAETLEATARIRSWFTKVGDRAPSLSHLGDRVDDLSAIAAVINEAIDSRGEVRDYASPRLAGIRNTIESVHKQLKIAFDRLLRQGSVTRVLQYAGATFHGDRMVLPLKAEHRGRIRGIIHRTSDSGATIFVEPAESVELNNSLVSLHEEERKEITQILRNLTQRVQLNAQVILATIRTMGVIDLIAAKCRYAKERNCICPEIADDGILELYEARHPLLVELFAHEAEDDSPKRDVVPIDVRLGEDFDVLMVTGPNTGGKTVTLKTVGLMALMAQCGMPIPAGKGSRLPVYRNIFIDVGDEQSLQQSLSTFSSHLATLLRIIQEGDERSLVLIDELGAGTDPDEGAAIGQAIVTELLDLRAKAIVTTHLSALKAIAYTASRVDNAAVEFDTQTLKPTYRLTLGEPGNSNAMIIAKRLGMPARVIQKAKHFLDDRTRALNKAIAGTLESRREAEKARKIAREAAIDANREREQMEKESAELRQTQEAFDRWTKWVGDLKSGDDVYLKPLRRSGKVVRVQLQKQTALVSARGMDIEVALSDVEPPREEE